MSHTTIVLDTRTMKKNGTYPLKIRVSHKGEFYIPLKIDLIPEQWYEGVVDGHTLAKRYNLYINSRKIEIDRILLDLEDKRRLSRMTNAQLKQYILNNGEHIQDLSVSEFLTSYLQRVHNERSRSIFNTMFSKVSKFCNPNTLTFDDINYKWLTEFDDYMIETGMKTNARSIYMRALRRLFNAAIDEELINHYPFRKFKIKSEQTQKRSLSIEQIRTLMNYPCEPHQERYRDMFMLSFYLIGINSIDLFSLKEINNGRIEYRRSKTARLFSIKIEPEAQMIIDKYRGKDYLLNVLDTYKNYKDFTRRINKELQQIGSVERKGLGGKKIREPLFPGLTTYWARHTWATIAAELDIPDETISFALGHSFGNRVTNIYINRNQKKVDDANRAVIDYLLK